MTIMLAMIAGAIIMAIGILFGVAVSEIRKDPSSRAKEISDAHIRDLRHLGDDRR